MPLFGPPNIQKLKLKRDATALVKALAHREDHIRREAAIALGELGDVRAVEPLIAALVEGYAKVRVRAAEVLGQLGDARAVAPLSESLSDEDAGVRGQAAVALRKFLPSAEVSELARQGELRAHRAVLRSKFADWQERIAAAEALRQHGDPQAVESFLFVWLYPYGTVTDIRGQNLLKDATREALVELGEAAVEPLIAVLNEQGCYTSVLSYYSLAEPLALGKGSHLRALAAEALGKLGDRRAVEPLIAALRDSSLGLRCEAARALGELGDARAVAPLMESLESVFGEDRGAAAAALGKIGEAAVEPLIALLRDARDGPITKALDIRASAAHALALAGDPGVEALVAVYKTRDLIGDDDIGSCVLDALRSTGQVGRALADYRAEQDK
jgi:HEAT repeat protein